MQKIAKGFDFLNEWCYTIFKNHIICFDLAAPAASEAGGYSAAPSTPAPTTSSAAPEQAPVSKLLAYLLIQLFFQAAVSQAAPGKLLNY